MLAKKSKILLSAFSILTFAMSMPYSTVFAENTSELDLPSVTIKGDKAYSVTIPKYLEDNKNTQKESNDNFDIYISKLNYNSDYGVVLVGLQAKKNIDTATFSLMVENGEIADSISAEATPDSNWYYKDLVESVSGGTLEKIPGAFAKMDKIYAGEYIQVGAYYKLENEDKIKVSYSFDGNYDEILKADEEGTITLEKVLGPNKGTSVKNLKINKKVEFMNFDELSAYIEKEKEAKKSSDEAKNEINNQISDKKYSSKKSEAKVETKTKYPWLFPSAIGGSILILLIAGLFGVRYIKK